MSFPKNLTNAVYEFVVAVVAATGEDDALFETEIQESDAESVKKLKKMVRVGSDTSQPDATPDGNVKDYNGKLSVEFLVLPDSQKLDDRVAAREAAHQMAMEAAKVILESRTLGNRCTSCMITRKENGYRNLKAGRYQGTVLDLLINAE